MCCEQLTVLHLHETTEYLFVVVRRFRVGKAYARTKHGTPCRPFELKTKQKNKRATYYLRRAP